MDDFGTKCVRCGNTYMQIDGNHPVDGFKTYAFLNGDYTDSPPLDLCPECAASLMNWLKQKTDSAVWNPDFPGDKRIRSEMPTAVFVDACGTTRDHANYNMIEDSVTKKLSDAAGATVELLNLDSLVYAATDEVTFLFPDARRLMQSLHMMEGAYEDYVMSTFLQHFERYAHMKYPSMRFKCRLFYVRQEDIGKYVESRIQTCHRVAAAYYAKEFLDPSDYHKKNPEEIQAVLKQHGLWEKLKQNTALYEGILTKYEHKSPFENLLQEFSANFSACE